MTTDTKTLIRKAFDMARVSGKPDWRRMTTAVLKNRLLMLTKNEFRESYFGANNMIEFVHQATEVVQIDDSHVPPVVELIEADKTPAPAATYSTGYDRVRPDLWRAVMDYSSGNKYVWDPGTGIARTQQGDDHADMLLPTIGPEVDTAWRREFVSTVDTALDEVAKGRVHAFLDNKVSPRVLPQILQQKWNEFVKAKILQTLADWFEKRKLKPPERLTVTVRRPARIVHEDDIEDLRGLVLSCVRVMRQDELERLSLPPSAVLRARRDKS